MLDACPQFVEAHKLDKIYSFPMYIQKGAGELAKLLDFFAQGEPALTTANISEGELLQQSVQKIVTSRRVLPSTTPRINK